LAAILVAAAVLANCTGCGNGRSPVGGKVTFDGKPVEQGAIVLEPADGHGPTTGGTILDGKYELAGKAAPLPGKKKVRITATRKTGRKVASGPLRNTMVDEIESYIPEIYNIDSTLTCEVSPDGSKTINFDLKPEKPE
jgi:hypothetical protein